METKKINAVLLVEDSSIDIFINTRVLEQAGVAASVVAKPSASAALNYLKETVETGPIPELIFLDIRMPDMDGFEFLADFEHLPEAVREITRVVMLSSSLDPSDIERARSNPYVLAFIPKPLTRDKLLRLPL